MTKSCHRVCRKICIYLIILSPLRRYSIWKSTYLNACLFSLENQSSRYPKGVPNVYTIFWLPYWCSKEEHQHGSSVLDSKFAQKISRNNITSQLWDNRHFLNLENCLFYFSSIISQVLDLHVIHWKIFDFIFHCMTMKTLYKDRYKTSYAFGWLSMSDYRWYSRKQSFCFLHIEQ